MATYRQDPVSHAASVVYYEDGPYSVDQPTQPTVPPGATAQVHPTLSAQTSESGSQ